jgi:hypothetical protein
VHREREERRRSGEREAKVLIHSGGEKDLQGREEAEQGEVEIES